MEVAYIPYKEIDRRKWDECITSSANRLIYARAFYLDGMVPEWDALVAGDYEAVMPLPKRRKAGISYVYRPAFMQQLGVFFKKPLRNDVYLQIQKELESHFRFADTTLNYGNIGCSLARSSPDCTNFMLDIRSNYAGISKNYLPGFTKSLRRIQKFGFTYNKSDNYEAAVEAYEKLYSKRLPSFKSSDYAAFAGICKILSKQRALFVREVFGPKKEILAGVVWLKDGDRLYNMISYITEKGRKLEANYFLYDELIKEFSGKGFMLDLEGSDHKGIASFYKKMSPVNQPYSAFKMNRLPLLLRLLKP